MNDKKLTDAEIVKVKDLLHRANCIGRECRNCHVYDSADCINIAHTHLLRRYVYTLHDEINRLQAENEDLEKEIDKQYEQARADILGNMADGGMSCHWCIEQHKAEAYKECIEKVKVYFRETRFAYDAENLCEELDELLEEKLGE